MTWGAQKPWFVLEDMVRQELQTSVDSVLIIAETARDLRDIAEVLASPAPRDCGFQGAYVAERWVVELRVVLEGTSPPAIFHRALRDPEWREALLAVLALAPPRGRQAAVRSWLAAHPP